MAAFKQKTQHPDITTYPASFFSRWWSIFNDLESLWIQKRHQQVSAYGALLDIQQIQRLTIAAADEKAWIINILTETQDDKLNLK